RLRAPDFKGDSVDGREPAAGDPIAHAQIAYAQHSPSLTTSGGHVKVLQKTAGVVAPRWAKQLLPTCPGNGLGEIAAAGAVQPRGGAGRDARAAHRRRPWPGNPVPLARGPARRPPAGRTDRGAGAELARRRLRAPSARAAPR